MICVFESDFIWHIEFPILTVVPDGWSKDNPNPVPMIVMETPPEVLLELGDIEDNVGKTDIYWSEASGIA